MFTMPPRPPRQVPPPVRPEGSPARTSHYSRFIPREELQGFSSWNPDAFHGAPESKPTYTATAAPEPAAAEAPLEPEAPNIEELLSAARQGGYQDGYRDGMEALDAFKKSFAQQMSAQIGELVRNFSADFEDMEARMAETLARCAVELARQVVRTELQQQPEAIARVAHDAVEALLISARHIRVRVHPEDLPLVEQGAGEELKAREAQLIPDPAVARGGCKVDSDISSVDASLPARWQQVMAAMGQHSLWEDRRGGAELQEDGAT
ncbi:flagellar biosynthesis protein [Mitsuaria sp. WAJ17]|uniref:FliH/SctL family protein n=1 Tax=Mitsuaria sp. WAJ17 TaxID=2761452 RepID=UPI0015FF64B2|nr:FliH/SctL family protein [Mitsuaria sp. WAJ17]MBB2486534.1 flagellar biosynthesis protein [Mitsuaria sp. WAJ17]